MVESARCLLLLHPKYFDVRASGVEHTCVADVCRCRLPVELNRRTELVVSVTAHSSGFTLQESEQCVHDGTCHIPEVYKIFLRLAGPPNFRILF